MTKRTRTLHFTLGENAGKLLIDIAREHLTCNYDTDRAMRTLTESLNCSKEIALNILSGKMVLTVDDDRIHLICSPYDPSIHKSMFPPFDCEKWAEMQLLKLKEIAGEWHKVLAELRKVIIRNRGEFEFSVRYDNLIKYFYDGDIDDMIDQDSDNITNIKFTICGIKKFIAESMKIMSAIKWMRKVFPNEIPEGYECLPPEVRAINNEFLQFMVRDEEIETTLRRDTISMLRLDNHISKQIEIDKIVSEGIKPVEITDNYNAGWLAPDGTFYGLNGAISNMLHNQIADALCAAGIIPSVDPKDPLSHNPDTWLERHGWAKIHGDWVLYNGWNLHRTDDKNTPMTPQQQEQICRYGQTCWKGLLKFGYSKEPISAARFGMTDIPMLRNYFEL